MRNWFAVLSLYALTAHAQSPPAEVMLFGVFHFANPSRDVVCVDQADGSTPTNQAYLQALAGRLCPFNPTAILIEIDHAREPEIAAPLEAYVAGQLGLKINEIHQIGFRVGKACSVNELYGFDENEVGVAGSSTERARPSRSRSGTRPTATSGLCSCTRTTNTGAMDGAFAMRWSTGSRRKAWTGCG
jgi:Family of unknown function (DUF5694)